ncbi:MAG: hypothetical protein PHY93_06055 [Bacteriovorax sp.]|nr:hypothetical protein [Bacteriovorax sp.]
MEIHKQSTHSDEFDNFKKSNLIIIRNLYRATPSPYPGSITRDQECGNKKSRPLEYEVKSKNMNFFVFEGAASGRFVLGVCDPAEVAYQGILILFKTDNYYCLVRVFIPFHEYEKNKEFIRNSLQSLTYLSISR